MAQLFNRKRREPSVAELGAGALSIICVLVTALVLLLAVVYAAW